MEKKGDRLLFFPLSLSLSLSLSPMDVGCKRLVERLDSADSFDHNFAMVNPKIVPQIIPVSRTVAVDRLFLNLCLEVAFILMVTILLFAICIKVGTMDRELGAWSFYGELFIMAACSLQLVTKKKGNGLAIDRSNG